MAWMKSWGVEGGADGMDEEYSGYSRYQFWNFDKNTPECRTRHTIDITTSIETNFGVHLPLPLFTF